MYEHLLDYPEEETIRPGASPVAGWALPENGLFMSAYQQRRQRVYDRAEHMLWPAEGESKPAACCRAMGRDRDHNVLRFVSI